MNNNNKCIIYVNSIKKCADIKNAILFVNINFDIKINIGVLHSKQSKQCRIGIINTFVNGNNTQIICNVHILDEAINIPECDSVYIISESLNVIKIIQRVCRCNRIYPNKVSGIYLYGKNIDMVKQIITEKFANVEKIIEIDCALGIKMLHEDNSSINNLLIKKADIGNTQQVSIVNNSSNIRIEQTQHFKTYLQGYDDINPIILNNIFEDTIAEMTLQDFLKKYSTVNHKFIDDFYRLYDIKNPEKYCVDLGALATWLQCKKKSMKSTLTTSYTINIDYILLGVSKQNVIKNPVGKPIEIIMLTLDTVKLLCMKSKAIKANEVRNYYLQLEILIDKYKDYIITSLGNKIKTLKDNQG